MAEPAGFGYTGPGDPFHMATTRGAGARAARAASVAVFGLFGVGALLLSTFAASMEGYTSSSPDVVSLFGLGISGCVAAAVAARRASSQVARLSGVLLLVPAVLLLTSADFDTHMTVEDWLAPVAAWLLTLLAGLVAGGRAQQPARTLLGYFRGDDLRRSVG